MGIDIGDSSVVDILFHLEFWSHYNVPPDCQRFCNIIVLFLEYNLNIMA